MCHTGAFFSEYKLQYKNIRVKMTRVRARKIYKIMGFTLMEVMIVVVIIGILASIAWPRYIIVAEKSRTAEAKNILGQIRATELGYYLEYDSYTTNIALLSLGVPTSCNTSFYYNYGIAGGGASFTATATRCTSGGKAPDSPSGVAYVLNITQNGVLGGTPPYV
jgi:type IV pilus assembly protein PilE